MRAASRFGVVLLRRGSPDEAASPANDAQPHPLLQSVQENGNLRAHNRFAAASEFCVLAQRPHPAHQQEMSQFHADDYVQFLKRVSPDNSKEYLHQLQKCAQSRFVEENSPLCPRLAHSQSWSLHGLPGVRGLVRILPALHWRIDRSVHSRDIARRARSNLESIGRSLLQMEP